MNEEDRHALRVVRDALDRDPQRREAFVAERCGGDHRLLARVRSLLIRAERIDSEQDAPSDAGLDAGETLSDALIGRRLGPFRVVERIGRGGMGVVYRGEREGADFRQTVALKLIRRGFDFDEVQARFLRERRILARLSHPNLARFVDGGVSDDGRPWFALEHVEGRTITRWCDEHRLDIRARLRLLLEVCTAVQYAHTQLVVHRDLKPGNILVDGSGKVRLLDFGIARLLAGDDEGTTTIAGARAFTPEYAAPEQLAGDVAGVAGDVYALGVIAYELVAGVLPYDLDRHDPAAVQQAARERPAQALTQAIARPDGATGSGRTPLARRLAARATTLRGYRATVRGDLARILDTALAKEPARRYATVAAFADDLQRWLDGAPVRASGNGAGYRLGKLVRRHRLAAGFALLALASLVAGVAGMAWQMREARQQRDAAIAEAARATGVRDYVMLMFRRAGELGAAGQLSVRQVFEQGAEQIFEHYRDRPEIGRNIALMLAELYVHLGDAEGARPLLERLIAWPGVEADPDLLAEARHDLAQVELDRGEVARARALLDQAQAWWIAAPERHALLLNTSRGLQASIEQAEGDAERAIATLEAAIAERRGLLDAPDRELGTALTGLAAALLNAGRHAEAMTRADESIAVYETLGLGHSSAGLAALNNRAAAAFRAGLPDRAAADFRRVVELRRRLFGPNSELADALNNLAVVLLRQGEHAAAIALLEEALPMALAAGGERGRAAFAPRRNLADAYVAAGRSAQAEPLAEEAVAIGREQFGEDSVFAGAGYASRARVRLAQGRIAEARADLDRATAIFAALGRGGEAHLQTLESIRAQLPAH